MRIVEVTDDLRETTVGKTDARNLPRALVLAADKRYGRDGWKMVKDRTLTGFYAKATDGRCLMLTP
jgi:hypothetical protein